MKKHAIISISIILIVLFLIIPIIVHAATFVSSVTPFGGRVITTEIPIVTCTGSGTGPVIIMNMNGLPLYTESSSKTPEDGGWILGNADTIPDFSTCYMQIGPYKIPFPVRKTSDYNVSNGF